MSAEAVKLHCADVKAVHQLKANKEGHLPYTEPRIHCPMCSLFNHLNYAATVRTYSCM